MNVAIGILFSSFILGIAAVWAWNRFPYGWLSENQEEPVEAMPEPVSTKTGANPRPISPDRQLSWMLLFCFGFSSFGFWRLRVMTYAPAGTAETVFFSLLVLWCLLLITMSDIQFRIIPDQLVLALLVLAALQGGLEGWALLSKVVAGFVCAALFFCLGAAADLLLRWHHKRTDYRVETSRGFGMGDVKLLFALGALLGLKPGLWIMASASVMSGVVLVLCLLLKRIKSDEEHPFGPYLCLFTAAALLLGG